MKTTFPALGLALAAALVNTSVSANTGTINFEGKITSSTCPIEVVNPGDGAIGNLVKMGSVEASRFTAVGQAHRGKDFALRVDNTGGKCISTPDPIAKVRFDGTADATNPDYFAVGTAADDAAGVAIMIKDKSDNAIAPGDESADYPLIDGVTDMRFYAYYVSTAATVQPGTASADVSFLVSFN